MDPEDKPSYDRDNSEDDEELVDKELRNLEDEKEADDGRSSAGSQRSTQSSKSQRNSPNVSQRRVSLGSSNSLRSDAGSPIPQFLKDGIKVSFVHPLEKRYECPCCDEVLKYPVVFEECGHRCCSQCFENEIKSSDNRRCPVDQNRIDVDATVVDKEFNREIFALEVKCFNNDAGCEWKGEFQQIQEHFECCEYVMVPCVNGCGKSLKRRDLPKHRDKKCGKRMVTCDCGASHLADERKQHEKECPIASIKCPNGCDAVFKREELDKHVDEECTKTKMGCHFENIGCDYRCSREKLPKHYKGDIVNHLGLLHNLTKKNKERVDGHQATMTAHLDIITGAEKRAGALERIAHNAMIWRIEDYARKFKDAKEAKDGRRDNQKSKKSTWYSPAFTTSKHGYRMSASICPNGDGAGKGTHLSVFISILKGAFDGLLKWPFSYPVTFHLLDQQDDPAERQHIEHKITPTPRASNEAFLGRPSSERNASFGVTCFINHETLQTRKYIKDDTIFIKVIVQVGDDESDP